MKSSRCSKCNVSSVRSIARPAQPERDTGAATAVEAAVRFDTDWFCACCLAPSNEVKPLLAKTVTPEHGARKRLRTGRLRVLLVDDEDIVRRCTARILSGFEIVSARSGAEALAILSEDADFDVVLSDVMMPGMTGPELFEHCCESHPRLAQRFVFASGDPENARHLLRAAVKRAAAERTPVLLTKPSTGETLMQAIFAAAAREAPRSGTWAIAAALPEVKNYRG